MRPFFRALLASDATGRSWLAGLLALTGSNLDGRASDLALKPELLQRRRYRDRAWGCMIELECCFERPVPPPTAFLRWLLENSDQMTWREHKCGENTRKLRRDLLGMNGVAAQRIAREVALEALERVGAKRSRREWWAFEGFTEVDCCLETDDFVLFVEGKRTEDVSGEVSWWPTRNQVIRNLDCANDYANGQEYYVMVMCDQAAERPNARMLEQSLPHRTPQERREFERRYLGHVTWGDAVRKFSLDPLPDTRLDLPSPCIAKATPPPAE